MVHPCEGKILSADRLLVKRMRICARLDSAGGWRHRLKRPSPNTREVGRREVRELNFVMPGAGPS